MLTAGCTSLCVFKLSLVVCKELSCHTDILVWYTDVLSVSVCMHDCYHLSLAATDFSLRGDDVPTTKVNFQRLTS